MIIDGKAISSEMQSRLRERFEVFSGTETPKMSVVYVGEDPVIESFLSLKRSFGRKIGVSVDIVSFGKKESKKEILEKIRSLNNEKNTHGIIIQLPLPEDFEKDDFLNAVLPQKDIDVLSQKALDRFSDGLSLCHAEASGAYVPPVVRAISEIFTREGIDPKEKEVLIIGRGRLVGIPAEMWLCALGARVRCVLKGEDIALQAKISDIIISGAGAPGILFPEMLKEGCVLIDAGTSESQGRVVGDADPGCARVCSVFTPVPGGVGPITVASLFENLAIACASQAQKK